MAHAALARAKINTEVTQPARGRGTRPAAGPQKAGRPPGGPRVSGEARESARHPDRPVIELECGIRGASSPARYSRNPRRWASEPRADQTGPNARMTVPQGTGCRYSG